MRRPEDSPHQSHWCQMLEPKYCMPTHMHTNINLPYTRKNMPLLFPMKSYVYTTHEPKSHIFDCSFTETDISSSKGLKQVHWNPVKLFCNKLAENKEQWLHHRVTITERGESWPAPLFLANLCRQKRRPPHRMSNYSNNFTCLLIPWGARHYEPTCQVPTSLSTDTPNAHRSPNSQLVHRKRAFWGKTVKEPLIKGRGRCQVKKVTIIRLMPFVTNYSNYWREMGISEKSDNSCKTSHHPTNLIDFDWILLNQHTLH